MKKRIVNKFEIVKILLYLKPSSSILTSYFPALPFGHQLFAVDKHRRGGGAFDGSIAVKAPTSDAVAGSEGGETAGGHEEIHHRIVEHGRPEWTRQFVLMMMVMVARRAAASQIAAAVSAMTSTAAGGAILRLRIAIGICGKRGKTVTVVTISLISNLYRTHL